MAYNADPDQLASKKPTDLDLHCLQKQGISWFNRTSVNILYVLLWHKNNINCKLCYDRALLPSIICLGRLRIASKYIFNLWQLRQGVDSLAQWLEHWIFNREDRVRFPEKTEYFFSYASFLCCDFRVVRWGLVRDWTLYAKNGFTSS